MASFHGLIALSVLTVVSALPPAEAGNQRREWNGRYELGTEAVKRGRKVTVLAESGRITCRSKKGEAFTVPVADITAVFYDYTAHTRALQWVRAEPHSGGTT